MNQRTYKSIYFSENDSIEIIISANICKSLLLDLLTKDLTIKAYIIDLLIKKYTNVNIPVQDIMIQDLRLYNGLPYYNTVILFIAKKLTKNEYWR